MLLDIDIETYSSADLSKCGVYKYSEAPDFEVLLFAYHIDDNPVTVVDFVSGESLPDDVLDALTDTTVTKWAHNAQFERVCLSRWMKRNYPDRMKTEFLDPEGWKCSMVLSASLGLPLSLKLVGEVLKLKEQKMATEGDKLIRYFCQKTGTRRNMPEDFPAKWDLFKEYNERDVEVEKQIRDKLLKHTDINWNEYWLDQRINDRGVCLDEDFVAAALAVDEKSTTELTENLRNLTDINKPNSVNQLKDWLADNGLEIESLSKKEVAQALETDLPEEIENVLRLRQQIAKSSIKKYTAMENSVCSDGRARGMFQFFGAGRTGRWAGRLIQLHNLPQNHLPDLEPARNLVRARNYEALSLLYDSIPNVLSELIRTAFIPSSGQKFIVADFSAIEARVLAWLARESWREKVFEQNGDIYCASASKMFGVPVEKHGQNSHLRQKGKVAELACIAEGQLVLTDKGLIPIEAVTTNEKVWDGEEWVSHEGVIYKGEREVITYDGLTATPDHLVWVKGSPRPVQFGLAAASGARLVKTGDGGTALWKGEDYQPRETLVENVESLLRADAVSELRLNSMAKPRQSQERKEQGLSALQPTTTNPAVVRPAPDSGKTALRKSTRQGLQELRRSGYSLHVPRRARSRTVSHQDVRLAGEKNGNRPDQQQRRLCSREYPLCNTRPEHGESTNNCVISIRTGLLALRKGRRLAETFAGLIPRRDYRGRGEGRARETEKLERHIRTARLYDLLNAGRHHRFTVSGCLVHNCGYGGAIGALKAMGALEMGLPENELSDLIKNWRDSNSHIVSFWWNVDEAAIGTVRTGEKSEVKAGVGAVIKFEKEKGILFVTLPSGRRLSYLRPKIDANQFGGECITYDGIGKTKKWERIDTYGPKLVENIVQATSRDLLAYAITQFSKRGYNVVMHVHDEIVIEADPHLHVEEVSSQMRIAPPWARGLKLNAAGFETKFYRKD